MNRTNIILAGILIVQAFLLMLGLLAPDPEPTTVSNEPLLADFATGDATQITITDVDANELVLSKMDDGGWALPMSADYPVQDAQVTEMLAGLRGLQTNRLIASNTSSHNRLMVSETDFERKVDITTSGGNYTLYVGTSSGSNATHMRLEGQDAVYLTSGLAAWQLPTDVTSWVDAIYFSQPREGITQLTIENENGEYSFEQAENVWTYTELDEGEVFVEDGITAPLRNVSAVRLTNVVSTDEISNYADAEPLAIAMIVVTTEEVIPGAEGEEPTTNVTTSEHTLNIYTAPISEEESTDNVNYVVKSSDSDFYVVVPETSVSGILELNRETIVMDAPEETPEATAEATEMASSEETTPEAAEESDE